MTITYTWTITGLECADPQIYLGWFSNIVTFEDQKKDGNKITIFSV